MLGSLAFRGAHMLAFLQNSSNQRKIAVAIAAILALFSSKLPFLADVNPDSIMAFLAVLATWIAQSGLKASLQAKADGEKHAAMIANANDAVAVFNQLSGIKVTDGSAPAPAAAGTGVAPVAVKS